MPWFDLPEADLREYRTAAVEPAGLDGWWSERLAEARAAARPATLTRYRPDSYGPMAAYDVEFSGADGDRIAKVEFRARAKKEIREAAFFQQADQRHAALMR